MKDYYKNLIQEICEEKNIKLDVVSNNWVMILQKNKKVRYITGYKFDLNTNALTCIIDDKFALYDTLNYFNIPIIKHDLFYHDYSKEKVLDLFLKSNKRIVAKANKGSSGKEVSLITDANNLFSSLNSLFNQNYSISICPFYNIKTEYRIIILDKQIKLIYGKKRPIVIGDGKKSVNELFLDFNYDYFKNVELSSRIPNKGEIVEYNWQFNLSKGAVSFCVDNEEIINKLKDIVKDILNIADIRFASIDIVDTDEGFKVMEINSGVTLNKFMIQHPNGREIGKKIYGEAIDLMFE